MTVVISIIRPSSPKSPFWPFTIHMVKLHFVLLNQLLITVLPSPAYTYEYTLTVFVDKLVFCLVFCGPLFIFWLAFALTVIRFKTYYYQGLYINPCYYPFDGFVIKKKCNNISLQRDDVDSWIKLYIHISTERKHE
jgi:hypothetical protein